MIPEEKKPLFDTQSMEEIRRMMTSAPGEALLTEQQPQSGTEEDPLDEIKRLIDARPEQAGSDGAARRGRPECRAVPDGEKKAAVQAEKRPGRRRNKKKEKEEKLSPAAENYAMLHDWVYVLAVLTVIFVFFFRLVGVSGSSMYPTLVDRDYLILESNFLYHDVKTGDIVVLSVECFEDDGPIVKRVIATGGQTVDIDFDTGEVFVDGVLQEEPYIFEPTYRSYFESGEGLEYPVTVPEGSLFVMGDNRNHSADSRYAPCGCVEESQILGKVLLIVIPGQQTDEFGQITGRRDLHRIGAVSSCRNR